LSGYHRLQSEAVELVSAALDPSNGRAARKARSFARCLSCLSYSVFRNFQMAAATDRCCRLKPTKAGKAVRFQISGAVSSARCGRVTQPQQKRYTGCNIRVVATGQNDVRAECKQLRRVFASALGLAGAPAHVDSHIVAVGPAQFLQALEKCCQTRLSVR